MCKTAPLWSDRTYLKILFYLKMGQKLNLNNPQTFNEKLQWLKLNDKNPEYTRMVDKVAVKDYVMEKIGREYLIPTLGVWDSVDDIDFDSLPSRFVLKCSHNSGGIVVCKDKNKLDVKKVKVRLKKELNTNYYQLYREWPYKNVPRRILAERLMTDSHNVNDSIEYKTMSSNDKVNTYFVYPSRNNEEDLKDLRDFKFFCFNGVPYLCQVISNRSTDEKIDFYDMNWHRLIGLIGLIGLNEHIHNSVSEINCPISFIKMKKIAVALSQNIPFVRIDLYEIDGKPYFGEITFYPAAGFGDFRPKEWNYKLGKMI